MKTTRGFSSRECDSADMVMHNCRIAVEGNGFTNALQLNALLAVHNYPSAICSVVSSADHSASQLSARLVQQQWANRSTCKTASPRSKCQRQVFDCFHNLFTIYAIDLIYAVPNITGKLLSHFSRVTSLFGLCCYHFYLRQGLCHIQAMFQCFGKRVLLTFLFEAMSRCL